jgi:HPt (histidine-containing phosphotransfer) domain-containing protein
LKRLLDVIGGDPEDLAELIEEFDTSTPQTLDKMKSAAAAGNLDALRIAAHSLKSNGRDFGAVRLANLCEALEHDCREGTVEDAVGRVSAISENLRAAKAALAATALTDV